MAGTGGSSGGRRLDAERARRRRALLEALRDAAALRRRMAPRQVQLERERDLVQARTRRMWGEVHRPR